MPSLNRRRVTTSTPATKTRNPSILNILIQLKNNAKSEYTIKYVDKALTYLSKHADLDKPEEIKNFIANLQTSNSYKKNLCFAYNLYCQYYKIEWQKPFYRQQPKAIRIPTKNRRSFKKRNSKNCPLEKTKKQQKWEICKENH